MTIEQAQAWVGRELTADETECVHLLVAGTVKENVRVLVANASCIVPTGQMSNKIPRGQAKDRGWPDNVDFTLRDFCLKSKDLEQSKSIFQVCARDYTKDGSINLVNYMTAEALMLWVNEIAPFGIKLIDLLDVADAKLYWEAE
jgi:hypothetical protein